jgi:general secretion pathway protein J
MRRCRPDGFTLLEVLVALTVLGLLLAGLAQGVRFGLAAWGTETRLSSGTGDFETSDTTLRHLIEGAEPGGELDPAPFAGSRDRLVCITALPRTDTPTGQQRVQATLLIDRAHRLVLRWRPYLHAKLVGPPAPATETELLRDVSRLELSYWSAGTGWVGAWRSPNLPTLVRIRLAFAAGDSRRWPDIIAAPWLDHP